MSQATSSFLSCSDIGVGQAVVLVPGLGGLGKFWRPVQTLLGGRFRTLAIDHPGMGGSPAKGPQSIDSIANEVLLLLDRLGIDRAHVAGHSTGGLVAQALALDAPGRVDKVVLSSTWAKPDGRFRALFKLRQQVLSTSGPAAYAALGEILAYPPSWYEQNMTGADPARSTRIDVALTIERIDMLLSYERAEELARIQSPVLIVGAPDDNIVSFNHAQELAVRIPSARLIELAGGHFTPTTEPSAYVSLVASFLGGTQ